jgi:hypothetical protein
MPARTPVSLGGLRLRSRGRGVYRAEMRHVLIVLVLLTATSTAARADDAIAFGADGLRLGATVIYPKPVDAAAYDPALDLVWFTGNGMLQVIDLREAAHKPVVIAKKFPKVGFSVVGVSAAGYVVADTDSAKLTIGKKSKITPEVWEGPDGPSDPDSAAKVKQIKKVKLVGAKWLGKLAKRKARAGVSRKPADMPLVVVPADLCSNKECTAASVAFGATKLQLVETWGNDTHGCVLYDPATKQFATPSDPQSSWGKTAAPGSCGEYWFDGDGKSYYSATRHCVLEKSVTCTDDTPWRYVGVAPAAG